MVRTPSNLRIKEQTNSSIGGTRSTEYCIAFTLTSIDKTNMHTTSPNIPVIDISQEDTQTADQLVAAAAQHGFMFVKGQRLGFTSHVLDDAFDLV